MTRTALAVSLLLAAAAAVPQAPRRPLAASRESAYRENNRGVALLEQYNFDAAAEGFRAALKTEPSLTIARLNLAIAQFYAGNVDAALQEARAAAAALPDAPQPPYLLGLIARAQNRTDEAETAFKRVLQLDGNDVGAKVNLGQVYLQQRKYPEALTLFREAVASEPYNVTAAYNLAIALTRSGATADGAQAMQRFQTLRDSNYKTTFSQAYLEQGRYAEAIASTGAEPELVDRATPAVRFVEAAERMMPGRPSATTRPDPPQPPGRVTLFDVDGDGRLDLLVASASGVKVWRNDAGIFRAGFVFEGAPARDARAQAAGSPGVIAGDYDNDGRPDLFLIGPAGCTLLHQNANGMFDDVTIAAKIPRDLTAQTAAFVDVDHDGDLDVVVSAPTRLLRNNGDGTFTEITKEAGLDLPPEGGSHESRGPGGSHEAVAIIPTDFDNRRDIDLLFVFRGAAPALFQNLRDGTFRDVAAQVGLPPAAAYSSAAAADVNKDGYTDFFFGVADAPGVFALSDGQGRFKVVTAPPETRGALTAQFIDYDNDGLLDVLTTSTDGAHLIRNVGTGWMDVTEASNVSKLYYPAASVAWGDLDGDGDSDAVALLPYDEVHIWRNDGADRNRSVAVRLTGRVSNRSGIGSKIEIRAGSLRQRLETASTSPAVEPADAIFGLGARTEADVIRVLWPSGVLQAETDVAPPAGTRTVAITELNRKPSSCPFLFTWNGTRFEFVTDFMGGGEMGDYLAASVWNQPDPDEYVRIGPNQLKPRDGRYELRVTNELEEAIFIDRLQLVAVDHPADVAVFPNEGLKSPPRPVFHAIATRGAHPPLAAHDEHGHDVLAKVRALDRQYVDDFALARVRGYAAAHDLVLDVGPNARTLLLTGWTDYAWSSDNVAAGQAGMGMTPPSLEVRNGSGAWRKVIEEIGFPVGRPQTVAVDLRGKFIGPGREVRIRTNMRIYWDRILVDSSDGAAPMRITRADPVRADLTWRGFSAEVSPDGREPIAYDYARVSFVSPWKALAGRYTREGDVRPLLRASDDMFVIARPGDEIALSFDVNAFPALAFGWTRTFLLYADGFSKEMNIRSASPDELAPLPFHAMTKYPYGPEEHYPDTAAYREYQHGYNTRVVPRTIPSIDARRR